MRKVLALVALALLAAVPAHAQYYSSGSAGISVTQANTALSFTDNHSGGTNAAFLARSIRVFSRAASANTCYIDFGDTTATTADVALAPGKAITISMALGSYSPETGWPGIGLICSTGQTATFDVFATRAWIARTE